MEMMWKGSYKLTPILVWKKNYTITLLSRRSNKRLYFKGCHWQQWTRKETLRMAASWRYSHMPWNVACGAWFLLTGARTEPIVSGDCVTERRLAETGQRAVIRNDDVDAR